MNVITLAPNNPHWARVLDNGPFSLCVIHKNGVYPSSKDINRLMMMMMKHAVSLGHRLVLFEKSLNDKFVVSKFAIKRNIITVKTFYLIKHIIKKYCKEIFLSEKVSK
jgi:hypothetical protein